MFRDLKSALSWGSSRLRSIEGGCAEGDAERLLEAAAGKKRFEIFSDIPEDPGADVFSRYVVFINKRRMRVPVAYILGRTEFMSLPFIVDERVLIPRKETELLVERALETLSKNCRVLDLCTGSANIAVSTAYYSGCEVVAADISGDALDAARENARLNKVDGMIKFLCGDMFLPVEKAGLGDFDMIVSNPPYVRSSDIKNLQDEVAAHEPAAALDGGADGLNFYREIAFQSPNFLKPGGRLLLETGYDQAGEVRSILRERFPGAAIHKDYSGIDRIVEGVLVG
jgi:release factor glutamine methyltransferase